MKKHAIFLSLALVLSACSTTFWVSPQGSDASPGTKQAPFLTLEHARDAVRNLSEKQRAKEDIVVYLQDGTYRLKQPFVLDGQDSGKNGHDVVYRAADGANPVISGAIRVQDWVLHDKVLNIYKTQVGQFKSRQLYVNGQRAIRAQTEPQDGHYPAGFRPSPILPPQNSTPPYIITGGIKFETTSLNPERWRDPAKWTNPKNIEAVVYDQWKMMSVPLDSITSSSETTGLITLQQPGWTNANIFFTENKAPKSGKVVAKPGIWSFWQVTRFENAYEFLDQPGEWYLNETTGWLYYIPRSGEDLATADVELPVLEVLVEGKGELGKPVSSIRFEGLTFSGATWLHPSSGNGYVSDQSGFHLAGNGYTPNVIGHVQPNHLERTPGNVRFSYGHNITFSDNTFEHLGAVGLGFDAGSQGNKIDRNLFTDISSAAIQLGGVLETDSHPTDPHRQQKMMEGNIISDNTISFAGQEFVDVAGIFVGFTRNTLIEHNTITDVPWSGIAMGWGWGLLDPGSFPGVPGAKSGEWGAYDTPTPNSGNRILNNRIERFLGNRWDGGAIYTTGQQGASMADALLIEGNVALNKRKEAGGNTFYTDGGSRYIKLKNNVSLNNPIGHVDLGPPPRAGDKLTYPSAPSELNVIPYGSDSGGCRTYGDISYEGNYWLEGPIPGEELLIGLAELFFSGGKFDAYSIYGFFNVCPYTDKNGVIYPANLTYRNNHDIANKSDVPSAILDNAGVRP